MGESAFAEKKGDLTQLELPSGVASFVKELRKVSDNATPIILALVEGRPRLLGDIPAVVSLTWNYHLIFPGGRCWCTLHHRSRSESRHGEKIPRGRDARTAHSTRSCKRVAMIGCAVLPRSTVN